VVAESPSCVVALPEAQIWHLVDDSHGVARSLLHLLVRRLRNGNAVISDGREQIDFFERQAMHDPLTGLANRRWLDQNLPRIVERASYDRHGTNALSLFMVDIDHFKRFNDTHGHVAGDQALRQVARTLDHSIRPYDIAARYGGEEFCVLLPDTGLEAAVSVAERVRAAVQERGVSMGGGDSAALTVSIGVASMSNVQNINTLVEAADEALYRAKADGRNCVRTDLDRLVIAAPHANLAGAD
jgi:diguanylate cyclase (GGDEF)-like protein